MTDKELTKFRNLLEKQLEDLGETAQTHVENLNEIQDTSSFDSADRATDTENVEVDSKVVENEANLALKIKHALERIDEGTYGVCEQCGQPIPKERLEAKPSVTFCVSCQEEKESSAS